MIAKFTRRAILSTAASGGAALVLGTDSASLAQAPSRPPNMVFIVADDMGHADISCNGGRDFTTANIDRIAAQGARFTQAYANSPVCTASRVAIITGRYQARLPVGLEEPLAGSTKPGIGLPPGHPTLPSLLKKAGYNTALVGKWHLGNLPDFGPLQSGYDHFYGFRSGAVDYFRHVDSLARPDLWDDDAPASQPGYLTGLLGDRAIKVIADYARGGKPFLLSLHFNAPHWPWEGPDDQAESDRLGGRNLRDFDGGSRQIYKRMILALDAQVGRVLKALEDNGLSRNTIVIFTSDNGGERFADTWPFNGRKTELLEGGLRVPALISWPARIPAGLVSEQVTANMDWLPTLVAAAGTSPDPAFPPDGINLLPQLEARAAPVERRLFWRYKALWQRAARVGDWKYLRILDNTFLFNVADDPMERANLKQRQKDIYARLEAEWNAWNATMLPETEASFTENNTGKNWVDRPGAKPVTLEPDPELH
ncbi:sulfatase family protein [Bradyrhizobium sp.]|uniref:sulfatase family protein n=1 Tax=Bradyrhizobium sp. TaxID=376 RepID=UPI003C25C74B